MNPIQQIELLNEKSKWLESHYDYYMVQKITLGNHLNKVKDKLSPDERDAIEIKIFLFEKLEEILRCRIREANNYINSKENPNDAYLTAHASTIASDAKYMQLDEDLNKFERARGSGHNIVTTEILTAKRELVSVISEDYYKLP